MEVRFTYQVPSKHIVGAVSGNVILVHAEVLNPGLPTETCFIKSVTGTGVMMLWGLKQSEELFAEVQAVACKRANRELEHIDTVISNIIKNEEENGPQHG